MRLCQASKQAFGTAASKLLLALTRVFRGTSCYVIHTLSRLLDTAQTLFIV